MVTRDKLMLGRSKAFYEGRIVRSYNCSPINRSQDRLFDFPCKVNIKKNKKFIEEIGKYPLNKRPASNHLATKNPMQMLTTPLKLNKTELLKGGKSNRYLGDFNNTLDFKWNMSKIKTPTSSNLL